MEILHEVRFAYKKRNDNIFIYEQQQIIIIQWHENLRKIRKIKEEGKKIIYMDETLVNTHHNSNYLWVDEGRLKVPSGKGNRLIIVHAGSREGWVNNASLVLQSISSTGNYHNEMNISHFMEWGNTQLLPNVPVHSAIVLDNASYHNGVTEKLPTKF